MLGLGFESGGGVFMGFVSRVRQYFGAGVGVRTSDNPQANRARAGFDAPGMVVVLFSV